MNTPTPTDAHYDLRRLVIYSDADEGAELIAESEARAVAAAVTALTCTHHNDKQRAECPVCLVTHLTAEVKSCGELSCDECNARTAALMVERDHWQKIAVSASHEREHNANVGQAMTAERDLLCRCLRDLVDVQNGAPLELRRQQWQAAMDEALAALEATEGAK